MKVVWHRGTGTYIALDECSIVDVPDYIEDVETYLRDMDFLNE
jgi:hypothetical protein